MASSLFKHLDGPELARAESIRLFADESRLARKPRCGYEKDYSVIRTAAHALTHPYIQQNSPMAYIRIVFDLDWHSERSPFHNLPVRYLAQANAWINDLGVPEPNWAAISKDKNSAHVAYELEIPVARHDHALLKPQRFLASIERAYSLKMGADAGYSGHMCKNPINTKWDFYRGETRARDLYELAEYVKLEADTPQKFNRMPRGDVGRNVYLFDEVRFWAYDNVAGYRPSKFETWQHDVIATAERINMARYDHLPPMDDHGWLPFSECAALGRSVARWTWANHGKRSLSKAFSELQAWRGERGAEAAAKVKRERMEMQIVAAIGQLSAQGAVATMGRVAPMVGCTKGNLSRHYPRFFQGTLH